MRSQTPQPAHAKDRRMRRRPHPSPEPRALTETAVSRPAPKHRRVAPDAAWHRLGAVALAAVLTACGGGGGGNSSSTTSSSTDAPAGGSTTNVTLPAAPELPASRAQAQRFLGQASFGATEADTARLMAIGYSAWIDEQFALPATSHRALWQAADAAAKAANANNSAGQDGVINAFWKTAATAPDQLRQRAAFALGQIFVISMQDSGVGDNPRAVAAYVDMLGDKGLTSYRQLLEAVALHPMMGTYLTSLRNQKADARTGRVPDENFAREVLQLFSIGLAELNPDGTPKLGSDGRTIDTYTPADIGGLARVFTGWSWDCPDWPDNSCFFNGSANNSSNADRSFTSMLGYPQYHSTEEKKFLGVTVAAQSRAAPDASLKTALDTLAAHPNVGPFIGRQLIQRLVTSNPSPAYVAAVAQAFKSSGGDMKATVKAVLMHAEARATSPRSGKLREPVLRLTALLRAFPHTSDSGDWKVGNTDNIGNSLGQTPMRAPSVFNFYRPGYVPPGTQAAAAGLAAPEMQLAQETSAAGYVNYMRDGVQQGVGAFAGAPLNRRDIQPDYSAELALAATPAALVDRVDDKLGGGSLPAALKTEITNAITSIAIPVLNATASNQKQVDDAKRARVNAAVFLTLVSPEFQVLR